MTPGPVDVLLMAFVRPDFLQRSVAPLRGAAIRRVYLALDGPRADHPDDRSNIEACERTVLEAFRGLAPVEVLKRTENLGMKRACVEAIDWFFTQTDAGLIIEDDCVVEPTFVPFAAELLERFHDDEKVMGISGAGFVGAPSPPDGASYSFVRNFGVWGWATWARAWRHNDPNLDGIGDAEIRRVLRRQPASSLPFRWFWFQLLTACRDGRSVNWDFPWVFSAWKAGGVFIRPDRNLVTNIGYDERSTQTTAADPRLTALDAHPMPFPLRHPTARVHDTAHDRWIDLHIKGIRWSLIVKRRILRSAPWMSNIRGRR